MSSLWISDVRPWGGPATDLHIVDGVFAATPPGPDAQADRTVVAGGVVLG